MTHYTKRRNHHYDGEQDGEYLSLSFANEFFEVRKPQI